jgi:uncharacterized protein (UPF0335 family)
METMNVSAQNQLRQIVEGIERLEEEKKALGGDVKDKYLEAKGLGFDAKIIRKIIALRKRSKAEREEEESIMATYLHALEAFDGTPMGDHIRKSMPHEPEHAMTA